MASAPGKSLKNRFRDLFSKKRRTGLIIEFLDELQQKMESRQHAHIRQSSNITPLTHSAPSTSSAVRKLDHSGQQSYAIEATSPHRSSLFLCPFPETAHSFPEPTHSTFPTTQHTSNNESSTDSERSGRGRCAETTFQSVQSLKPATKCTCKTLSTSDGNHKFPYVCTTSSMSFHEPEDKKLRTTDIESSNQNKMLAIEISKNVISAARSRVLAELELRTAAQDGKKNPTVSLLAEKDEDHMEDKCNQIKMDANGEATLCGKYVTLRLNDSIVEVIFKNDGITRVNDDITRVNDDITRVNDDITRVNDKITNGRDIMDEIRNTEDDSEEGRKQLNEQKIDDISSVGSNVVVEINVDKDIDICCYYNYISVGKAINICCYDNDINVDIEEGTNGDVENPKSGISERMSYDVNNINVKTVMIGSWEAKNSNVDTTKVISCHTKNINVDEVVGKVCNTKNLNVDALEARFCDTKNTNIDTESISCDIRNTNLDTESISCDTRNTNLDTESISCDIRNTNLDTEVASSVENNIKFDISKMKSCDGKNGIMLSNKLNIKNPLKANTSYATMNSSFDEGTNHQRLDAKTEHFSDYAFNGEKDQQRELENVERPNTAMRLSRLSSTLLSTKSQGHVNNGGTRLLDHYNPSENEEKLNKHCNERLQPSSGIWEEREQAKCVQMFATPSKHCHVEDAEYEKRVTSNEYELDEDCNHDSEGCYGVGNEKNEGRAELPLSPDQTRDLTVSLTLVDGQNKNVPMDDQYINGLVDECGLVDVYGLVQNNCIQAPSAGGRDPRSHPMKTERLLKYLEQLKRERNEARRQLQDVSKIRMAIRKEISELRDTLTDVCNTSVLTVGDNLETKSLEPTCYKRYANIKTTGDATKALKFVRNHIKALNDLEVLIYRQHLVLIQVFPNDNHVQAPPPKRINRPTHKIPKSKRSEQPIGGQPDVGNVVIEIVSSVPETNSLSKEISNTESPLTISTLLSVSNEGTASSQLLTDTEI